MVSRPWGSPRLPGPAHGQGTQRLTEPSWAHRRGGREEKVSRRGHNSTDEQPGGHLQLQTRKIRPGFKIRHIRTAKEENHSKYWDFFLSENLYANE